MNIVAVTMGGDHNRQNQMQEIAEFAQISNIAITQFLHMDGDMDFSGAAIEKIVAHVQETGTELLVLPSGAYCGSMAVRAGARLNGSSLTDVSQIILEAGAVQAFKRVYSANLMGVFRAEKLPLIISLQKSGSPSEHNRIMAVGRGIKSRENTESAQKLAENLNVGFAASRPVVLSAWAQMEALTGVSGNVVAPETLLVLGASGQAAFVSGIEKSKRIIAVNTDKDAPIFKKADYGYVGDCVSVLKELEKLL